MHCKSCKFLIEDALEDINVKPNVNMDKKTITIEFDENKLSLAIIKKAIVKTGYTVN